MTRNFVALALLLFNSERDRPEDRGFPDPPRAGLEVTFFLRRFDSLRCFMAKV
ncbi:hypothetical protein RMSM_05046 [Rhodopirellula maiorica SM1]|uniref:Uncharacterized protein n=1 Tax=Rhodopirellula maiorica SM1 TaxID=1265738 RepID=M5RRL7_9BACT|nr:hypothetical protein RMSM_05046 [Rhodopirellula maiorica SM1]